MEITETALVRETSNARHNITGLHERGIAIALDDFGTGYGSLTLLHKYPIDLVKIDRSFLVGDSTQVPDHRIIAGIISLAGALGVSVTAEGVETAEQAAKLRALGCPTAQGWRYSKAIPPEQVPDIVGTRFPVP